MIKRALALAIAAMAQVSQASGSIEVEILGAPSEIYSFEPVYVLIAVQNTGPQPVLIPASSAPGADLDLYTAARGQELRPSARKAEVLHLLPYAENSMWLGPGETWLHLQNFTLYFDVLEGEFEIQAVLTSSGRCGRTLTGGRSSYPIEDRLGGDGAVRGGQSEPEVRCWSGEARSRSTTLRVLRSTNQVDLEAETFLKSIRALESNSQGTSWSLAYGHEVLSSYPTSHFSYAILTFDPQNVELMRRATALFPDNPLNPWVNAAIARRVLDFRSSCWAGEQRTFNFAIGSLELPPRLQGFLEQYSWNLENRLCPLERERQKVKNERERAKEQ